MRQMSCAISVTASDVTSDSIEKAKGAVRQHAVIFFEKLAGAKSGPRRRQQLVRQVWIDEREAPEVVREREPQCECIWIRKRARARATDVAPAHGLVMRDERGVAPRDDVEVPTLAHEIRI